MTRRPPGPLAVYPCRRRSRGRKVCRRAADVGARPRNSTHCRQRVIILSPVHPRRAGSRRAGIAALPSPRGTHIHMHPGHVGTGRRRCVSREDVHTPRRTRGLVTAAPRAGELMSIPSAAVAVLTLCCRLIASYRARDATHPRACRALSGGHIEQCRADRRHPR